MTMSIRVGIIVFAFRILNAIPDPKQCFNGQITSHYTGDSLNIASSQWLDISGNNNHAIISGSGIAVFDGIDDVNELYLNSQKVVFGPTTAQITFNPSFSEDHTLIHLCKYRDVGTARRIIQAESFSFISGFWAGKSGISYYNGAFLTSTVQKFKRRWVLSSQTPKLYRANFIDYTKTPLTGLATKFTINRGSAPVETSAFACAEVILIDQILAQSEIECIENYFNEKYLLKAVNNPNSCLTNRGSLAGWYDGNSYDNINKIWKDKSGLGYLNNVIIAGTGFGYMQETVSVNELYVNNEPVIYGSTATVITFPPILQSEHTVFSVCKYRESGHKNRIIQSEDWNGVFGFWNGKSGLALNGAWITSDVFNRFGNRWVISAQTPDLYRGNMVDFTERPGGSVNTRLMINKGAALADTSDFACAEMIIINEELQNNEISCIENYLNSKYNIIAVSTTTSTTPSPTYPIAPTFPAEERCQTNEIFHYQIILDESGSITADRFNNIIKPFTNDIIQRDINHVSDVSIIIYDHNVIELHRFDDTQQPRDEMLYKLNSRIYDKGKTHTGEAMQTGINQFVAKGYNKNNIIFLLTDGKTTTDTIHPCDSSIVQELNDNGIKLIAIGIGVAINQLGLQCADETFEIQQFTQTAFTQIHDDIRDVICIDCQYYQQVCSIDANYAANIIDYNNKNNKNNDDYYKGLHNATIAILLIQSVIFFCLYLSYLCLKNTQNKPKQKLFKYNSVDESNDSDNQI